MKMKYLYMSFLLALVYSCSDSGDNSDYSEMLKKDFNQEIKWDVDSLALMRASWEKTDLGNGAAVCTAQASMWGTTQSVSYVVYPTTMFSTRVAVCDTPAKTSMIAKDKKALFAINGSYSISGNRITAIDSKQCFFIFSNHTSFGRSITYSNSGRKHSRRIYHIRNALGSPPHARLCRTNSCPVT